MRIFLFLTFSIISISLVYGQKKKKRNYDRSDYKYYVADCKGCTLSLGDFEAQSCIEQLGEEKGWIYRPSSAGTTLGPTQSVNTTEYYTVSGFGTTFAEAVRSARKICLIVRGVFKGQCHVRCEGDSKAKGYCESNKTIKGRSLSSEDQNMISNLVCENYKVKDNPYGRSSSELDAPAGEEIRVE